MAWEQVSAKIDKQDGAQVGVVRRLQVLGIDYNLVFQRENLNLISHCIWEAKRYVDGDGCRKNGVYQGNER